MAKRELAPGRWQMKGDETRPGGCKYPTPPFALAKILPETTVRAYFSQMENDSPTTNTFLTFSTNILCPCMYTRGESSGASSRCALWFFDLLSDSATDRYV